MYTINWSLRSQLVQKAVFLFGMSFFDIIVIMHKNHTGALAFNPKYKRLRRNNTNAFGKMLVNEGHISQSSFSRYFANSKIGRQYVFCLYNPKSLSFLFLARMSKCVYHKTDTEGNMITGLCARRLRKSIDSN